MKVGGPGRVKALASGEKSTRPPRAKEEVGKLADSHDLALIQT